MGPCTALPMSAALCICLSMLLTWAAGVTAAQTVSSEAFSTLLKDQQAAAIESHTATDLHSRECAVKPPNATLLAQAQVQTAQKAEQLKNDVRTESSALILINVYAHVISQGPALTGMCIAILLLATPNAFGSYDSAAGVCYRCHVYCRWQRARLLGQSASDDLEQSLCCHGVPSAQLNCIRVSMPALPARRAGCLMLRAATLTSLPVVQFALVNVSRTINAAWYNMAPQTSTEITAKTQLRSGNNRGTPMLPAA